MVRRVVIRSGQRLVYGHPLPLLPELVTVGRDTVHRAGHLGLDPHTHETMEICYVQRGEVRWWAQRRSYRVPGGHVYVTWPGELHGGSHGMLNPCKVYWLGIPLWPGGRSGERSLLDLPIPEARNLVSRLEKLPRRSFPGPSRIADSIDRILDGLEGPRDALLLTRTRGALLEILLMVAEAGHAAKPSPLSPLTREAIQLMESRLSEPLLLPEIAARLGKSQSHLKHRFRRETGLPPAEYYLRLRITEACRRLESAGKNITVIAMDLGFPSSQYFATAFKHFMGLTPQDYRAASTAHRRPSSQQMVRHLD